MSKFDDVLLEGSPKRSLKPLSNNEFSARNTAKVSKRDFKMLNYIKFFVYTSTLFFCSFSFGQVYFHDFGTTAISTHPYTDPPGVLDGNLSGSSWTNTTGAWTSFVGASGVALSLSNSSGTPTISLEFDVNSGCSLDLTSFSFWRRRSSTGAQNWSMSINGTTVGSGAVPTTGANTGNLPIVGQTGLTGSITIEIALSGATGSGTFRLDDFRLDGSTSCGPPPSNTITTGTVSPLTYNVDCTTGEAGTVGFTSTEVYNGGNVFTAELSDATGSFAAPTSIGTLAASGTDPSGTINITIPAGTASGTGYRIRVVSSDPVVTGTDNGTNITINLTGGPCVLEPPHITSLIINSCNSSCDEGNNEVAFLNTGDYSVLMNSANFELTYGSDPSPTTNYTDPLVSNSGTTDDLNVAAGCPGLFVDATNTTVPPNSSIMLANDEICPGDVLDFGNLCGSGPIYVVYSQDPSWSLTGNFVNSSSGIRYLQTTITAADGSTHVIDYEFDSGLHALFDDGDYATWNFLGGEAIEQGNNGCTLEPVVLPITLIGFSGYYNGHSTDIAWQTLSEQNNDYFALYHSTNGKTFDRIGKVPGSGNTSTLLDYSFEHRTPHPGINYYKLKSVDYDGTIHDKGIIAVQVEMNHVFYDQITQSIQMNYSSDYAVYGSDGRLITRVANQNAIPFSGHGVFHVIDERSGKAFKLGIW